MTLVLLLSSSWPPLPWRRGVSVGLAHAARTAARADDEPRGANVAATNRSMPRRGDMALARARVLATNGRLRDALAALDLVRPTDAQKADADRLRADIQKQLIELASLSLRPADKGDGHEP